MEAINAATMKIIAPPATIRLKRISTNLKQTVAMLHQMQDAPRNLLIRPLLSLRLLALAKFITAANKNRPEIVYQSTGLSISTSNVQKRESRLALPQL